MPLVRTRHRFSVDDYEQMIARGILTENDRVELIRGEILDKMPPGDLHAACVKRLNRRLSRLVGDAAIVSVQDPIRLADSQPEPDLALLRPRNDYYASGTPRPGDVLLVVEVADTSFEYDRTEKRQLYAEAGIGEFWLVNLNDGSIEIFRQPQPDGSYRDVQTCRGNERITVAALPAVSVAVVEVV